MPHLWIFFGQETKLSLGSDASETAASKGLWCRFVIFFLAVNWAFVGRETSHLCGSCHLLIRTTASDLTVPRSHYVFKAKSFSSLLIQLICIFICELSFGSQKAANRFAWQIDFPMGRVTYRRIFLAHRNESKLNCCVSAFPHLNKTFKSPQKRKSLE